MSSLPAKSDSKRILRLSRNFLLLLLIYMGARAWIQRDLASGTVPPFNTNDLAGELVDLRKYQDEPVLLHFWASWCGVCAAERGVINAVNADWNVVSVAMQSGDNQTLEEFINAKQINWRTLNDESGEISARYGVRAVPTSFIVKEGKIVFAQRGYITRVGLRLRLLAAKYFF